MDIPQTIPLSSVVVKDRIRTDEPGIEALADSIADLGLIQPLVLIETDGESVMDETGNDVYIRAFRLNAGGRRLAALTLLGVTELHHATTCDPQRPGFILKGEEGSLLSHLLTELNENLNRVDVDWRDNVKAMVKAYRLARAEANERGEELSQRTFGVMLGGGAQDLRAAVAVHDAVVASPERFKDITSIRGAYALLLKDSAKGLEKVIDRRLRGQKIVSVQTESQPEAKLDVAERPVDPPLVIPLTSHFLLGDSITALEKTAVPYDHIICDPDYGVSAERLAAKGWSPDTSSDGVAQDSVDDSLSDLRRFIRAAFGATRDHSFLIFWYDLDHHEKLSRWATECGWHVQRWPIIWHKTDFRGNASPGTNFCKNIEYAMVCRKPGATLQAHQPSSVFSLPGDAASKEFNHPFAKPVALWQRLFSAVTVRGQSVFDPFMGSGSSCVAALRQGLSPYGMELNPDHYNNALCNLRREYEAQAEGRQVQFV